MQLAPITVNDGKSTPLSHVFSVQGSDPASWREAVSAVPIVGQPNITLDVRGPKNGQEGIYRVRLRLALPAMETVGTSSQSGIIASPKVAYSNQIVVEGIFPTRGTSDQRKDARVMLANLLTNTQIIDVIENLVSPW